MIYSESDLNGQACFLNDEDEQMSTPKYYQIIAMITTHSRKGAIVKQIPTFYLAANVQGIMNVKHAEKIAKEIISPRASDLRVVDVTVVEVY
jgi:hypothetical protein